MKLRAGVYGLGPDGLWTARALAAQDECELAAAGDAASDARDAFAAATGLGLLLPDYEALLATGIDFVVLAGCRRERMHQVRLAAEQGVHCLLHTPMALSGADATVMAATCEAAGVQLGVLVRPLADPVFEQLRRMIAADWLGGVVHVQALAGSDDLLRNPPTAGDPRLLALVAENPLLQLASHHVHLASWLCGRPPVAVTAQRTSGFLPLPADGAVATVTLRGNVTCTFAASHLLDAEQFAIHGTDGFLRLAGDRIVLRGRSEYRGEVFDYGEPGHELQLLRRDLEVAAARLLPTTELHARFARAIDLRDDFPCSGEQAAMDLRLCDAMARAMASGRTETPA